MFEGGGAPPLNSGGPLCSVAILRLLYVITGGISSCDVCLGCVWGGVSVCFEGGIGVDPVVPGICGGRRIIGGLQVWLEIQIAGCLSGAGEDLSVCRSIMCRVGVVKCMGILWGAEHIW